MTSIGANRQASAASVLLETLLARGGHILSLAGDETRVLDQPELAYVVIAGAVDLFGIRVTGGEIASSRHHVLRADAGCVFFGFDTASRADDTHILATGMPGTHVVEVPGAVLQELARDASLAAYIARLLDGWISTLGRGLARDIVPPHSLPLAPGEQCEIPTGHVALPRGGVVWVRNDPGIAFLDRTEGIRESEWLALTPDFWLRTQQNLVIHPHDTLSLLQQEHAASALSDFHSLAVDMIATNQRKEELVRRERLVTRIESDSETLGDAFGEIASLLTTGEEEIRVHGRDTNALIVATEMVGRELGLELRALLEPLAFEDRELDEREIAHTARLRIRQVRLEGCWWRLDAGPILARRRGDNRPVALLPKSSHSYSLHDPVAGTAATVTEEVAGTILPRAHVLYRSLPQRRLSLGDLLGFGLFRSWRDLGAILVLGAGTGLAGVATPIAMQRIFDDAIPAHDRSRLLGIALLLLAITIAAALLQLARGIAALRLTSKLDGRLQAALWDRLLNLPAPFFRRFTAGDLANRALGISVIRDILAGTVTATILSAFFSFFNLGLLFYYSPQLAAVSIGLVTIAVVAYVGTGAYQVRFQRRLAQVEGDIAGSVLQILSGIEKFRVVGGEGRAFALWASLFRERRHLSEQARGVENRLLVFNAAYPILTTMAIFADVAITHGANLTSGRFIAFTAAFAQVLTNALGVGATLVAVLIVIPIVERARPILEEVPEVDEGHLDPGELTGAVDLHHVSFRYSPGGPLVLDDVSISAKPGEFVALVGPSGSGKSTIVRILLGFERPEFGGVYYDNQDLAGLDVHDVRRQIGTVLQHGRVLRASMLENILGASRLTVDEAWTAARMAGLEDDIKGLPMGMNTLLSEESGTFSGGQRQRLMIARALVHHPRILLFDEATSALDNATQETVSLSVASLRATRIVIAHRLSTISKADRIYVLDRGRVVQHGSYEELLGQPGLFADLVRRQLT